MRLSTVVHDCLYLNWALPLQSLPALPAPLRHDAHRWRGEEWGFVSLLLFRQHRLKLTALPLVQVSHPQCNLRYNTHAPGEGPSVYFGSMLLPFWIAPAARLVAHQPARSAIFSYPERVTRQDRGWSWTIRRGSSAVRIEAALGTPQCGPGPRLGDWRETVAYFRRRSTGYNRSGNGLRQIRTEHQSVPVWPVRARVTEDGLLHRLIQRDSQREWPDVHSAWICPEIPFTFSLTTESAAAVRRQVPATG